MLDKERSRNRKKYPEAPLWLQKIVQAELEGITQQVQSTTAALLERAFEDCSSKELEAAAHFLLEATYYEPEAHELFSVLQRLRRQFAKIGLFN